MDTPTETGAVVQGSEQVRIGAGLDPRLIDEYDGSGDVVEWHTQASLLCEYRGVSAAEVLPMRLKGGAFAVWSQLSAVDRRSATATRDALFKAFAMDDFAAHTAFVARRLEPGESADVFLASLRRYAALFGGVTDRQLVAAFVNGLPASVADTIRAGTSGTAKVTMECQGKRVTLAAFVVPDRPLGVDMVLGMSGITALGGISLRTPTDVRICAAAAAEVDPQGLALDAADFSARFEAQTGEWTVAWKWADGEGPEYLQNQVAQYAVPPEARPAYDAELELWIREGWLQPYDERVDGPVRGLIPLMAVPQPNQDKVRPVLDYRELNGHIIAHTADADVCADQLRRWRRHGARITVVDLRKAYLQLRLDRRLRPYQTVEVRGQRYCLTRIGFGLSIAPAVMKAVVRAVLLQDEVVARGVLPYVDDLLVDEEIVSADHVVEHFARYGLDCKPPERAAEGARLLGLRVSAVAGELCWRRDNPVPAPPEVLTRRAVFAWCGQLVSHLPVVGWLRPAAAWLKRRVNALTAGWDDPTEDVGLRGQVDHVVARLNDSDPARGPWRLKGDKLVVWTDASSIAAGVVLEDPEGGVVEDASWLRPESKAAMHINMAELDAALSGVNMAIAWGITIIDLCTDSATVHKWIDDALTGRSHLRTKAHGEMLIRRRIDVIRQLVEEFNLRLTVVLVKSADNLANALTRVPKEWLQTPDPEPAARPVAAAVIADPRPDVDLARIRAVHENAAEVTNQLENIFLERGAPAELLLDNATEFRSRRMAAFAARWGVRLRFRAVHEAGGNGIVERHHRTVKTTTVDTSSGSENDANDEKAAAAAVAMAEAMVALWNPTTPYRGAATGRLED
ncbi:uncharacterized protein LOC122369575 [Amphibalanus amphitrite]|uniref:uncharacterized protein LOC122369575 n=1 Tax=Amphibalanus amphitrite TaxID=1232801 RepID=UPI001C90AC7B|nr:uncharacterized protein LOC122369575 [Amphibalanus amphitrite]